MTGTSNPVDVLITGGTVVDGGRAEVGDLAVSDGKVVALNGLSGSSDAVQTVDATGSLVLPGLVDGHFHCAAASASPVADDMRQGTISAIHGGVTTVLVHVFGNRGQPLPRGSRSLRSGLRCPIRHRLWNALRGSPRAGLDRANPGRRGGRQPIIQVPPRLPQKPATAGCSTPICSWPAWSRSHR